MLPKWIAAIIGQQDIHTNKTYCKVNPLRKASFICFSVVVLFMLTACGNEASIDNIPYDQEDVQEQLSTSFDQPLPESLLAFGLDMYEQVNAEHETENVLISPVSIAIALAMTYNGADGETKQQMAETLYVNGIDVDVLNNALAMLNEVLTHGDAGTELAIANSIWARENDPFLDEFVTRVQDQFDARLEERDLQHPETVDAINDWVADATNGAIDELLEDIPEKCHHLPY